MIQNAFGNRWSKASSIRRYTTLTSMLQNVLTRAGRTRTAELLSYEFSSPACVHHTVLKLKNNPESGPMKAAHPMVELNTDTVPRDLSGNYAFTLTFNPPEFE